jgi:hypothetical protein
MPLTQTSRAGAPIRVGLPPVGVPVADVLPITGEPVRRRRNPYIVLIIITGIIFIGLGTWLTVRYTLIGMSSEGLVPDSVSFRFAQALTFTFAAPLVTIGFLALVGVGFFLAARRR